MDEFFLHWDAAMNTDQDVVIVIYRESLLTDGVFLWSVNDNVRRQLVARCTDGGFSPPCGFNTWSVS